MLEYRVLGPLEVADAGVPVRLGGPRQRATLAILLLDANRVVPVERLADELYSGRPPVTAVTQVQRQVSELRRALGSKDAVETRPPGYVLRLQPEAFDLARFERLTADARAAADARLAATLLLEALELWRGPPLADLAYEPFARAAVARLEELRLAALGDRIDAELELGRHAALVGELEALADEHPLHERFRAQLMLALYRTGRQTEALAVYRRTRETLVGGFGLEPSSALQALERSILAHDAALEPAASPPEPSRGVLAAPAADTRVESLVRLARLLEPSMHLLVRLVDGEDELAAASTALRAHRLYARTAAFVTDDPAADLAAVRERERDRRAPRRRAARPRCRTVADAACGAARTCARARRLRLGHGRAGRRSRLRAVRRRRARLGGARAWRLVRGRDRLAASPRRHSRRRSHRPARREPPPRRCLTRRAARCRPRCRAVLADPGGLVAAVADAGLVVVGISPRWRHEGIGETRRTLVRDSQATVLVVHRGPRPGGLAPRASRTQFTWTIGG